MERGKTWRGYPTLSKPLTIMGVERRWFLLSATLGLALWNAINSIVVGALIFAVLYGVGFWAWKQDPNMLEILRASAQFRARYDPGKWAQAPWTLLIGPEPEFASWAAICDGMKWPPAGSSLLTSRFGASSRHFSLLQKRILSMKRHRDEHDLGERWSWTHDEFDLLRNRTDSGPITT